MRRMPTASAARLAALSLVLAGAFARVSAATTVLFMKEHFGVSNPLQPVEVAIDASTYAMLQAGDKHIVGPDGLETPFQLLASNKLLLMSSLPGSPRVFTYDLTIADPDTDQIAFYNRHTLPMGWPVTFSPTDGELPGGLAAATLYYINGVEYDEWYNYPIYRIATSPAGTTIDITAKGNAKMTAYGLILTGTAATSPFYRHDHQYFTGMPLVFDDQSPVDPPAPLAKGTTYYVVRVDADRFRLALSADDARAGTSIALEGVAEADLVKPYEGWVRLEFTVADGAPVATVSNAVATSSASGGKAVDITNGLTGVRVLMENAEGAPVLSPIQGILGADGEWYADSGDAKLRVPTIYDNDLFHKYNLPVASDVVTAYSFEYVEKGPLLTHVRVNYKTNRTYYGSTYDYPITAVDLENDIVVVSDDFEGKVGLQFHRFWLVSVVVVGDGVLPCGLHTNTIYSPNVERWDKETGKAYLTLRESPNGPRVDLTCEGTLSTSGVLRVSLVDTTSFAGDGFFTQDIEIYAGSKSVLITDDFDTELQYFVNLYKEDHFEPTTTRYRGFGSTDLSCGYHINAKGEQEPPTISGLTMTDALRPIDYTNPRVPQMPVFAAQCGDEWFSAPTWYMGATGVNSGYYWLMYDENADDDAPMFGYYLGHLSSYFQTLHIGPSIYTAPHHEDNGGNRAAGFTNYFYTIRADGSKTARSRKQWAIYASTKGELLPLGRFQAVAKERHSLVGINLSSMVRYQLEFPSPDVWSAVGGDAALVERIVHKIKTDAAYVSYVESYLPTMTPVIEMLRVMTPAAIENVVRMVEIHAFQIANIMANADGAFDKRVHFYTMIGEWQSESQYAARIALYNGRDVITEAQANRLKACLAYVHGIIWDTDFMPYDREVFNEAGNPNQNAALLYHRAQAALVLPSHPAMAPRLATARKMVLDYFNNMYVSPEGAPRGGTWYQRPGTDLAVFAMLEFGDYSDTASFARLEKYAQWYLSAATTVEPQIGGGRKLVALGDGSTYSSGFPAVLASLMRRVFGYESTTAAELQWLWKSFVTEYSTIVYDYSWAPSLLMSDLEAPVSQPPLSGRDFPGYWTSLRQNAHTPEETALWLIKGPFYIDHRHFDMNHISIYALSAPMCIDWNANVYNPPTPGAYLHNKVLYESSLPAINIGKWDEDSPRLTGGEVDPYFYGFEYNPVSPSASIQDLWKASYASHTSMLRETNLDYWKRAVLLIARTPSQPIIYVRDSCVGTKSRDAKVLTWWFEADGAIETVNGTITPPPRYYSADGKIAERPSATPKMNFTDGDFGRFGFTGNHYRLHRANGIDFDVHIHAGPRGSAPEFIVGAFKTSALSGREDNEAWVTLNKTTFFDQQYAVRVRTTSDVLETVMLPVEKGDARTGKVRKAPCGTLVERSSIGDRVCLSPAGYSYADGTSVSVTAVGAEEVSTDSTVSDWARLAIKGNPGEVSCDLVTGTATVRLVGPTGKRHVKIVCFGPGVPFVSADGALGNEFQFDRDTTDGVTVFTLTPDWTPTGIPSGTYRDPLEWERTVADGYNGFLVNKRDGKAYACLSTTYTKTCMYLEAKSLRKWTPIPKIAGGGVWIRGFEVHSGLLFGSPSIEDHSLYVLRDGWHRATDEETAVYARDEVIEGMHVIPVRADADFVPISVKPVNGGFHSYLRATRKGVGFSSTADGTINYTLVFDCSGYSATCHS